MQDDLTWPRREPEKWRGIQISREQARKIDLSPGITEEVLYAIDEAQGDAENGSCYLLIKIVDAP